jgi:hypothetical protein
VLHCRVIWSELWRMQNVYALCTRDGLAAITGLLDTASDDLLDALRARLAIGLHRGVVATSAPNRRLISAF